MAVSTRSKWTKVEPSYEPSSPGVCDVITSESFPVIEFALLSPRTTSPTDSSSTADAARRERAPGRRVWRATAASLTLSLFCLFPTLVGCDDKPKELPPTAPSASGGQGELPKELYLPTGGSGSFADLPILPPRACPQEMVLVAGRVCVDRYEVTLFDRSSQLALSPHYPPTELAGRLYATWVKASEKPVGRLGLLPLPELPNIQRLGVAEPAARAQPGVLPQGYLSRVSAERACHGAGKRLCTEEEWLTACRGEKHTNFPYGDTYREGRCNVRRASHPARILHGDASRNHLDPRLGLTADDEGPLLRKTGETPACKSVWGEDAIFDMVGNIDEWVSSPEPTFLGGFFSRATTAGCMARIASHESTYLDYSLGTRCCKSLE